MSDIFLSYKSEDRPRAKIIAEALERHGYSVWWDRIIPPGKTFDQVIEEALDASKCVIILWSRGSVSSDWVKNEAREGKRRRVLIPVLIDDVKIPFEFRHIQAAQLIDWQGALPNPEFDLLLKSVGEILGKPLVTRIEDKKTSINELNLSAQRFYKEGKYSEAIDAWKEVLNLDPENTAAKDEIKKAKNKIESKKEKKRQEPRRLRRQNEEEETIKREMEEQKRPRKEEDERRQKELSALYSKGIEGLAAQDWKMAIEQFKEALAIDAEYKDASAKLKEAEQQLDLAKEREKALKEEEERKVREKQLEKERRDIELREKEAKEAQLQAQKEAERLEQERRQQESRQAGLSALYSKGIEALEAQDWQTAIKHFNLLINYSIL